MQRKAIRLGVTLLLLLPFSFVTVLVSSSTPSSCFAKITGRVVLDYSLPLVQQMNRSNIIYEVRNDFDLAGSTIRLPSGSIIEFNGGRFYNGLVVGEKMPTKKTYRPEDFGAGLSDDTYAIQSCLNICRNVTLEGSYQVSSCFDKKDNVILSVPSETSLVINGIISLSPVDSPRYSILSIKNSKNISITGSGKIIGDKETTNVLKGEHGMGISITGESRGITVDGLEISNCFGDAIYIGVEMQDRKCLEPSYLSIKNCTLHRCRRQGISIVIGHHIEIDNCNIHHIQGTAPESAIDIESEYKGHYVHDVSISNSSFNDCVRVLCCGGSNIQAQNIKIDGCNSNGGVIEWRLGDKTLISNCIFHSALYVDNVIIEKSFIKSLFYKSDEEEYAKIPNIKASNSEFRVVGYVNPNGFVEMKDCIIYYPADFEPLNGYPLRGGYMELVDCTCSAIGTNYKYAPEVKHLKAKSCTFYYNKSTCLQGEVLDLKKCVLIGENIEGDNTFIYARRDKSRLSRCKVYYMNKTPHNNVWVIRAGNENGLEVVKTEILSNSPNELQTKNVKVRSLKRKTIQSDILKQ